MFKTPYLQILLFVLTLISTTVSGSEWIFGKSFVFHHNEMGFEQFKQGFWFSIPFLAFLTSHEFGHYFMAKYRKIRVTLPYYIPAWFVIFTSIGTFGAFIKIQEMIKKREDYFDIGIAGPLAGFVVAVGVLAFGFYSLPSDSYIFGIHPNYQQYGANYRDFLDKMPMNGEVIVLGKSLIYNFLESTFADPSRIPHPYELTHYPLIVAGFLGLLFTAINLLPVGQLDGGHILYALIGKKAFKVVSPILFVSFMTYSGLGIFKLSEFSYSNTLEEGGSLLMHFAFYVYFTYLCFSRIFENKANNWILTLSVIIFQLLLCYFIPNIGGYSGFLAFGFLIGRVLGVYHPETKESKSLDSTRIVLGVIALLIFIICFSPNPIQ